MTDFEHELASYADAAVSASMLVQEASSALSAARQREQALSDRRNSLAAQRAEIVNRRARGDQRAEDAQQLSLLDADLEGLSGLLAPAQAAVGEATQQFNAARASHAASTQALDTACRALKCRALVDHAIQLDALLLRTISEIEALGRLPGHRVPPFGSSQALRIKLLNLAVQRGDP